MTRRVPLNSVLAGSAAALLLGLAAPHATARDDVPSPSARAAADEAVKAPVTRDTLSRFFAHEGAVTAAAAEPRIAGDVVPVYYLAPDFVAGKKGASVARLEFLAAKAVASDGQEASLWTVKQGGSWKVVNIATGDDETHYARVGAEKLPGGTVFHEPQINAWYVTHHARVLPLDQDAARAIGTDGTSLAAYRKRVERAYGDKLPGSAYAASGKAGGYAARPTVPEAQPATTAPDERPAEAAAEATQPATGAAGPALTVASTAAGLGACGALALGTARAVRSRRRATGG